MPGYPLRLIVILLVLPVVAWATAGVGPAASWAFDTRMVAVGVAIVGLAMVGGISAAGWLAARSHRLLLALYAPSLVTTLAVVTLLVIGHAVLLSTSLYALLGWWDGWVGLIAPVLVPLTMAVFGVMAIVDAATSRPDPRPPATCMGHRCTRDEAPDLWACVDAVAARLGVAAPDHIVLSPAWEFVAVAPEAHVGDEQLKGRILICSLLAGDVLSVEEFRAVVAHGLGYFHEGHVAFTERYLRVFERGRDVLQELEPPPFDDEAAGYVAQLALLPARSVMEHFVGSFIVAERALAREAALLQDAIAASATSPLAAAAALAKLEVYVDAQHMAEAGAVADLLNCEPPAFRRAFEMAVTSIVDPDVIGLTAGHTRSAPLDSHPPLGLRLAHLGVEPRDLAATLRAVPPTGPASALYGRTSGFEMALFLAHVRALAESGAFQPVEDSSTEVTT